MESSVDQSYGLENEIIIERVIRAPCERVFRALQSVDELRQWWGPRGFKITTQAFEAEPNGEWRFVLHGPGGVSYQNLIVFNEIIRPEMISYTHGSGPTKSGDPHSFEVFIHIAVVDECTAKVQMRIHCRNKTQLLHLKATGAEVDGKQTLQRLEDFLLAERSFTFESMINGSIQDVFEMWTQVEHLREWLAPVGFSVEYKKAEIQVGGESHYSIAAPNGSKMWCKARYHEIESKIRLVYSQFFSDEDGDIIRHPMCSRWPREVLTTVNFEVKGHQTRVRIMWTPQYANSEELQAFELSREGIKNCWIGTFNNLRSYFEGRFSQRTAS